MVKYRHSCKPLFTYCGGLLLSFLVKLTASCDSFIHKYLHDQLVTVSPMASSGVSQPLGHSCWKQWWRRSPNTCFSKKILLLLVWQMLFAFFWLKVNRDFGPCIFLTNLFAPLISWLADVTFGRYKVIKFGSIASFLTSVWLFVLFTVVGVSTLSDLTMTVAAVIINIGATCYSAAMLPFLTDQLIGATLDELSTVVHWYVWAESVGFALSDIAFWGFGYFKISAGVAFILAVPLAMIIISDCFCQQWLDRTHKFTNPIKLIIQVLNYTRKHSYPERRSAFTYIDEEQPTRMDYGKEKFGGPFTEEEVEDVKTVLCLLPLVICLTIFLSILVRIYMFITVISPFRVVLWSSWLIPLLLIPFYQLCRYIYN